MQNDAVLVASMVAPIGLWTDVLKPLKVTFLETEETKEGESSVAR